MIFNGHEFVKQTVKVEFKNLIKTTGYKSVKQLLIIYKLLILNGFFRSGYSHSIVAGGLLETS